MRFLHWLDQLDVDFAARMRGATRRQQIAGRWWLPVAAALMVGAVNTVLAFTLAGPVAPLFVVITLTFVGWLTFNAGYWYRDHLGPEGRAGYWLEGPMGPESDGRAGQPGDRMS